MLRRLARATVALVRMRSSSSDRRSARQWAIERPPPIRSTWMRTSWPGTTRSTKLIVMAAGVDGCSGSFSASGRDRTAWRDTAALHPPNTELIDSCCGSA